MIRLRAFTALSLGVFFSLPSFAVTVEPVEGHVTINRGDGIFRPMIGTLDADIGDSVIVRPGGLARIVYDDGCTVGIHPGDVHTISGLSPCKAPALPSDSPPDYSILGTLAVGGGVAGAIIILLLNKDDDKPASP